MLKGCVVREGWGPWLRWTRRTGPVACASDPALYDASLPTRVQSAIHQPH